MIVILDRVFTIFGVIYFLEKIILPILTSLIEWGIT